MVAALLAGVASTEAKTISNSALETGFIEPSAVRTSVYWYWISDYISAEGIVKDLHAMKDAGINCAYIGNIGVDDVGSFGPVKFESDEWWHAMHTALKTAAELDIEIGIFNSPGWSQSGGPWVKPEQAMRYLKTLSTQATGGKTVEIKLDPLADDEQDVKILAYPRISVPALPAAKVKATPELKELGKLTDGDQNSTAALAGDEKGRLTLDFAYDNNQIVRTVKIFANGCNLNTTASFQAKIAGKYTTLSNFKIDRYNAALNVGFNPNAPIVVSVPATSSKEFRLVVNNSSANIKLSEIELSAEPTVERYPEKTLGKMFQEPLPYWHEYQWKTQPVVDSSLVVDPAKVVDISQFAQNGTLTWQAPEGEWVIKRFISKPTGVKNSPASPESTGLECDKMSREHIQAHFDAYMGEIIRRIPAEDRRTWKYVVQDSYEMGGQNYTDDLFEAFQAKYGYDPIPFLPALDGVVVESQDSSDRFLWDLRRMIADRVAYDYVGGLRDISHKYGLKTWLECYGHWGFPGEFLQYGGQSDEIGGEFWAVGSLGDIENRAASSCGHIYGKDKISAESFTCGGEPFGRYPAQFKARGDRFFAEGINSTLLHLYIQQPYEDKQPGINAWFGTEFNRFNTWFRHLDLFTDYLKRADFMLQQGLNVADVAYFIGEDTPKMTGVANPPLPCGYQFDYMNAEVIERDMTVKNGLLTLPHGTQYKILVLPQLETMRPELLKKIKSLIEAGAVVLGPAPGRSPSYQNYPNADKEVAEIAAEMWKGHDVETLGKGKLLSNMSMEEALAEVNCVPDMRYDAKLPINYGHRTLGDREIYFVSNQSNETVEFAPEFRVTGLRPELWDAVQGTIRNLPAYRATENGTVVPLRLAAQESAFIVFRGKAGEADACVLDMNFPVAQQVAILDKPWNLHLQNDYLGIDKSITLNKLESISKNQDEEIQHFSGTLTYTTTVDLTELPDSDLFINLNRVEIMAKVKVNDQYVGGLWTAPYRLNVTDALKVGTNKIEIEVVTTWVNGIIGNHKKPADQKKLWSLVPCYDANTPLRDSGLLGPVVIEKMAKIQQ